MSVDEQPVRRERSRGTEWLLWERLRTDGAASRAQLARDTGLSKPTVSAVLDRLGRVGLVREAGRLTPDRGRTAVLYEPDPAAGHVLGIDIGRARLRAAVADLSGALLARVDVRNTGRSAATVAEAVVAAAEEAVADAGITHADLVHTAVGTPGVFDAATGRVRFAVNLPGWGRPGLFETIRARLGGPDLSVHNDANLAALGEAAFGAGAGSRLFVYALVGTGLGVGIVADGQLFTGAHGAAGEIGYWARSRDDRAGAAAGAAPLEEYAGGAGALARARAELGDELAGRGGVAALTASNDSRARAFLDDLYAEISLHTANLAVALDPERIVVGGGYARTSDAVLEVIRARLDAFVPYPPELRRAHFGADAASTGAIALAQALVQQPPG